MDIITETKLRAHEIYDKIIIDNTDDSLLDKQKKFVDRIENEKEPFKSELYKLLGKDFTTKAAEEFKYNYQQRKKKEKAAAVLKNIDIVDIENLNNNLEKIQSIQRNLSEYDPFTDNIDIIKTIYSIENKENSYISDLGLKLRHNGINIIGAITGHGKTVVIHNLFVELLEKEKICALFTLEAPEKEALLNLLEIKTRMQEAQLKEKLHDKNKTINDAKDFFYTKQDKELFIYDNIYMIEDIIKKIISIKRFNDDKELFVFIDYIQLIEAEKDFSPKTYLIEYALKQLINIANKEGITFIITCQVNREGIKDIKLKKDIDKLFNPLKSYNLKDSASIEHSANRLYTIFNKYYYLIDMDKNGYEVENYRGYLNIKSNKVRNEEFTRDYIQLRFDDCKKLKLMPGPENNASGSVNNQEKNENKFQPEPKF